MSLVDPPTEAIPSRAELRRLLDVLLPGDNDLNGFVYDYFPSVLQRFQPGLSRNAKLDLLLTYAEVADLHRLLRERGLHQRKRRASEIPDFGSERARHAELFGRDDLLSTLLAACQQDGWVVVSGAAGVGKTAALRAVTATLNPHRYQVIYHAETDFGRLDLYRCLAQSLGLAPSYRRALLWREIKAHIHHLADGKQLLPVWILDEAQNLPPDFFRDFPAFLNFAFDSRDLMSVWLVGHPVLAQTLQRAPYAALAGRIQARVHLTPVFERERFARLIEHGLKSAGNSSTLLTDSGMEILRQASKGLPRNAARILRTAMRLALPRGLNHLPDELLQLAIEELR